MKQGWEIKKLGEVVDIINGKNQSQVISEDGAYPIYGSGGNIMGYATDFICEKGTTIIGRKGNISNPIFINERFWNVDTAFGIFPKSPHNPKFINYLCQTIDFKSRNKGTTIPSLVKSDLQTIEIPFPKSLPEQQRIVSILDEAFAIIAKAKANAEKNLKNAKELFESYLQGVFENKGEGWEETRLGEIATFRNGMNFTKSSRGERINIVGVKDFQNSFWVPFETLETVTLDGKLNDLDLLEKGDILAVRSNGNPQLIGRTLLASEVVGKVSHSGFTIRIRLNTKSIDPVYLCNYLKISSTRKILVDGGNGVGIKSLNQGSLSALIIPFPQSLKSQQTIIQKLNVLSAETQKLEANYQQKINDLEELKKSVLQKAFSGELKSSTALV
jgi:type I restriction enzyme S subunit